MPGLHDDFAEVIIHADTNGVETVEGWCEPKSLAHRMAAPGDRPTFAGHCPYGRRSQPQAPVTIPKSERRPTPLSSLPPPSPSTADLAVLKPAEAFDYAQVPCEEFTTQT